MPEPRQGRSRAADHTGTRAGVSERLGLAPRIRYTLMPGRRQLPGEIVKRAAKPRRGVISRRLSSTGQLRATYSSPAGDSREYAISLRRRR